MDANRLGLLVKMTNPNIEEKLKSLIEHSLLTDREKDILLKRWYGNLSLKEVADEYSVTRERIRQVEAKAFRKLKRPPSKILEELISIQDMRNFRASLELILDALTSEVGMEVSTEDLLKTVLLDDLELSVRPYNCLGRAGIRNAYDLTQYSLDDLRKVRNLGIHSYNEILEKMSNVPGFEWRGEDDE